MSIYESCVELIHTYIYGGAELTADMNLVMTLLATTACIACFALPFVIVWLVIKLVVGGWR